MVKEVNHFPWTRYCKLSIVSGCLRSFRAKFRRQNACPVCIDRLRSIGLSIGGYKKMTENKREEKIELLDDGKIKMQSLERRSLMDGSEVKGLKTETWDVIVTREDLEVGLENKLVSYNRLDDELTRLQEKIEAFGDIKMSPELEKLQKDVLLIGEIEKLEKLKAQVEPKQAEFKVEEEFKIMREGTLKRLDELEKEKGG